MPFAGGRLTTDEPERRLCWESPVGQVRSGELTFAPLAGASTWLVLNVTLAATDGDSADSRWVDRQVREARDSIEEAYLNSRQSSRSRK